ncbi:MAG: hypothetical protein AB8G77_04615 [Rhodothermales bacterium]
MISIFDNIIAIMIAGVVVIILFSIQQRSTDFNIEQTSIYSAKNSSLDFANWIEEDLKLVGTNIDHGDVMFIAPTYTGSNTSQFLFLQETRVYPGPIITRIQTRYDVDSSSTIVLPDTTIQLYELIRHQRDSSSTTGVWSPWVETGAGPQWLSYFRIDLMNNQGQLITTEPQTAFLEVAFTLAMPNLSSQAYIREFNWSSQINIRQY